VLCCLLCRKFLPPVVCSYLFVEDVAEAFDMVLHKGEVGEVYNIGTEKERSVLDVSGVRVFATRAWG
jgi:dTDP-D-glucose 4,6-dehydratase